MEKNTVEVQDILRIWSRARDGFAWAMAVIVATEGHSYRKVGAFALVNDHGHQLGMLSGGCLEADINLMARKCLSLQKILTKEYDGRDENDSAYQLGCGGIVWVRFIPLVPSNDHLQLNQVFERLDKRQAVYMSLKFTPKSDKPDSVIARLNDQNTTASESDVKLVIKPTPHLLIVGGGKDAIPVSQMAKLLRWQVTIWDPRSAYTKATDFDSADTILRGAASELAVFSEQQGVDYAILMSHSVEIDAQALQHLASIAVRHISLLGPKTRFDEVLKTTGLNEKQFHADLSGPAGLDIGGELPSSIALSIISHFHFIEHKRMNTNEVICTDTRST